MSEWYQVPMHMLPICDQISQWERSIWGNDPVSMAAYADWCEEQGWQERARALRSPKAAAELRGVMK